MKSLFLIFSILMISLAVTSNEIINYYKQSDFQKSCAYGKRILQYTNGEVTSIIGVACSKIDAINILGDVIKHLNKTATDRNNASYFATLILEKKLIYQFMNDHIDLTYLVLPKTPHILSRVFEKLSKKEYKVENDKVIIKDGDFSYVLFLSGKNPKKLYILEYKFGKLLKKHLFV